MFFSRSNVRTISLHPNSALSGPRENGSIAATLTSLPLVDAIAVTPSGEGPCTPAFSRRDHVLPAGSASFLQNKEGTLYVYEKLRDFWTCSCGWENCLPGRRFPVVAATG